jgi:hypothetical protein
MAVSHFASRNMPGAALRPAPFVGRCAAIAVLASLGGCAPRAAPAPGPHGDRLLHFVLDSSLARDRDSYEREVSRALADVYAFFSAAGLDLTGKLIDSVTVFGGPAKARAYLASTYGVSVEQIPATFSGTVEGTSLFLVSRGAYQQIWHRLYPDWNWTTNTYRQLVAHELCHRAHEIVVTARRRTRFMAASCARWLRVTASSYSSRVQRSRDSPTCFGHPNSDPAPSAGQSAPLTGATAQ